MLDLDVEEKLFKQGYKLIAGIDEAGRGPLAGPVVAACVVIKPEFKITKQFELIKDSKKLSAKKREELFNIIKEQFDIGIGMCDHKTIDKINILQAAFLSMKKAIGELKQKPDFIMLDGRFKIPNCSYKQKAIVRGDESVFSIAAASIIAKVTRDRIMRKMHDLYSNYGFDQHKGYGTRMHLEKLKKHGPCAIHRTTFKPLSHNMKHVTRNIKYIISHD